MAKTLIFEPEQIIAGLIEAKKDEGTVKAVDLQYVGDYAVAVLTYEVPGASRAQETLYSDEIGVYLARYMANLGYEVDDRPKVTVEPVGNAGSFHLMFDVAAFPRNNPNRD